MAYVLVLSSGVMWYVGGLLAMTANWWTLGCVFTMLGGMLGMLGINKARD